MNKKDIEKIIFIVLLAAATIIALIITAMVVSPRERSSKAERYDLECTTAPVKNPLKECKK